MKALLIILLTSSAFCSVFCQCSQCCCDVGRDVCLNHGSDCTSCLDGYWGKKCNNRCPTNCTTCEKEPVRAGDGSYTNPILYHICTKCIDGKYLGDTNDTKTCELSCLSECITCTSLNNCSECKPGYYFINGSCIACSTTCIDCISETNCTSCITGYYGDVCDLKCSLGCKDVWCDKVAGTCTCSLRFTGAKCDQCAETFYGQNCGSVCSTRCLNKLCQSESGLCKSCAQGLYGELCNQTCSNGCKFGICSREDAMCFDGCLSTYSGDQCCVNNQHCLECSSTTECLTCVLGYHGNQCELPCSSTCKDSCIKSSGECNSCSEDQYGKFCQYNCSKTCVFYKNNTSRCSQSRGECLVGCEKGYYGVYCRDICNTTCTDGTCDRIEGLCLMSKRVNKSEETEMVTYDQHVKQVSIAVVVTFILSISLAVAAYCLLSFIRRRTTKNKPIKENRHTGELKAEPYNTLSSEQPNTGSDYDIITSRNDDYANTTV